jgi:hypothetical protein
MEGYRDECGEGKARPTSQANGSAPTKADILSAASKPQTLPVNPEHIPGSIKALRRWVVWKWTRRKDKQGRGRWTKPPVSCKTGRPVDVTDPANWATFAEAVAYLEAHPDRADGIGFVLGDGYAGCDLDDCRNPVTGEIAGWAADIIRELDSFADVSPTGTGVKVLFLGRVPPGRNRTGHVELYSEGRYFTLCGCPVPDCRATVEDRQVQLEALCRRLFGQERGGKSAAGGAVPADDYELLERARAAGNGQKFTALFDRGDVGAYDSASEADLALCCLLAFWVGNDPARIDRLFRSSALCRDKWTEREDYRALTIKRALEKQTVFYDWSRPARSASGGEAAREQAQDGIRLGPLRLVLDRVRQAPSGRVSVTFRVVKAGAPADVLTVSATRTGRRDAARQLQALAPDLAADAVAAALASAFAAAARRLDEAPAPGAEPALRGAVRDYIRTNYRPTCRVGRRVFLAGLGQDYDRPAFLQLLSADMLNACRQAARIPASEDDYTLMARIDSEMRLVFGDLVGSLPHERKSLAGAVVAMWSVPRSLTKVRVGNEEKTHNTSLIGLTLELLGRRKVPEDRWLRIHPAHPAFVRKSPVVDAGGEVHGHETLLAMNAELSTSTGVKLPDGINAFNMKKLGRKDGIFRDVPGVCGHAERKQTRVIVLSAKMTRFLLEDVSRDGTGAGASNVSPDASNVSSDGAGAEGGNYGPDSPYGAGGEV